MKSKFVLLLLVATLAVQVQCICKDGEGTKHPYNGPLYNGGPTITDSMRVETYTSANPGNNLSPAAGSVLRVTSYNIQSGLNDTCNNNDSNALVPNLGLQSQELRDAHFWGLQEVDEFNDLRCNCSEPNAIADATGHTALFFFLIYYRSGKYGSAMGTPLPYTDTRFKVYQAVEFETKGVLAIRTQPPQVPGRHVWFMNTHLTFNAPITRTQQAAELVNFTKLLAAEFPTDLIIVTGDYYTIPRPTDTQDDKGYATLAAYFSNAWATFNGGDIDGGETYPSDFPNQRYDHVWFKFPSDVNYAINVEVRPVYHSDHRPLHVSFDFSSTTQPTNTPTLTTANAAATAAATTTAAATSLATSIAVTSAAATSAAVTSAAAATSTSANSALTSAAATSAAATSAANNAATSASATTAAATSAANNAATTANNAATTSNNAATLSSAIALATSTAATANAAATSLNTGASTGTIASTATNAAASTAAIAAAIASTTAAAASTAAAAAAASGTSGSPNQRSAGGVVVPSMFFAAAVVAVAMSA